MDDREVTEKDPPGSDYLAGVAVRWEDSTRGVEEMGVRRVVIRTGLVFAKDEGTLPRLVLPFRMMVGGPLGSGKQWLSWIHILDEARAIHFLIEDDRASGPYNLTAPVPATNADFGRVLARVMGKPYWMLAPAFLLQLALGEMSALVLEGQRVLPCLQQAGFEFAFPTLHPALEISCAIRSLLWIHCLLKQIAANFLGRSGLSSSSRMTSDRRTFPLGERPTDEPGDFLFFDERQRLPV
jgi:uncharacterized protein (TIGR01777 family)